MLSVPVKPVSDTQIQIHATTVSVNQKALMIAGPSGAGKSSLALRMIALGAALVADDVTELSKGYIGVTAHAPTTLPPLLEVRGLGLLNTPIITGDTLDSVLDLGVEEADRLPVPHNVTLLGQDVRLFYKPKTPYIAEAMMQYLTYGLGQ